MSRLASACLRRVRYEQLSKPTSWFLVLLVTLAAGAGPRGPAPACEASSQLFLPAAHLQGSLGSQTPAQTRPGQAHLLPPLSTALQIPSRAGVPLSVSSTGPATPHSATSPLPLPDLAWSGHLKPLSEAGDRESGRKLQGSAQNLPPASQPCRPS